MADAQAITPEAVLAAIDSGAVTNAAILAHCGGEAGTYEADYAIQKLRRAGIIRFDIYKREWKRV